MLTEEMILKAYQDCGKEEVDLMKLENQHKDIAEKIVKKRQSLAEKKSVLAEYHREISSPLLTIQDPKLA